MIEQKVPEIRPLTVTLLQSKMEDIMEERTAMITDLMRLQGDIRVSLQRHGGIRGPESHRVSSDVLSLVAASSVIRDEYREVYEEEMQRSHEKLVAKMEEEL